MSLGDGSLLGFDFPVTPVTEKRPSFAPIAKEDPNQNTTKEAGR